MWLKPRVNYASGSTKWGLFFIGDTSNEFYAMYHKGGVLYWNYKTNANLAQSTWTTTLNAGTWYMLTFVFDGSDLYLYSDTVQRGTAAHGFGASNLDETDTFQINHQDVNYGDGVIDEFSIWNRTLNSSEIASLYNAGAGIKYPVDEGPTDSCTYSGDGDWYIDCNDNCTLITDTDLLGNDLIFTNANGTINLDATLYNFSMGIKYPPCEIIKFGGGIRKRI